MRVASYKKRHAVKIPPPNDVDWLAARLIKAGWATLQELETTYTAYDVLEAHKALNWFDDLEILANLEAQEKMKKK